MEHQTQSDGRVRFRGVVAEEQIDEVTSLSWSKAATDGYIEIVGADWRVLQRVAVRTGDRIFVEDGAKVAAGARIAYYSHEQYRDRPFADRPSGAARLADLLRAHHPDRAAVLTPIAGTAKLDTVGADVRVRVEADDGASWQRVVGRRHSFWLRDGDQLDVGDVLTDGERDHHELLALWGRERFEAHLFEEIDQVFTAARLAVAPNVLDLVTREAVVDTPDGPRLRPLREFPDRSER